MIEDLTQQIFRENLNSGFLASELSSNPVEMRLIKVIDLGSTPHHQQYSLVFLAPGDTPILQKLFHLEHAVLGALDLLLVPIGRDDSGVQFEAIINRLETR